MGLRLHNTLTGDLDEFISQTPNLVKLYTCGPTVYDYLHVGNWAAYIYWDTLVRILRANSYDVERVMNITDVGHLVSDNDEGEDKLEKGAKRENKTAWDVAQFYTDDFVQGMKRLNLIAPTQLTRATEFISEQLALVQSLFDKGYTYQIDDGIYFDTSKFPTYADFAHLNLAAQKAGARVEYNPEKRNHSDFALWKFTPAGETRDMQWVTPASLLDTKDEVMGFPGWHLECSAMAMSILGETLDIHTGGIDHIPVHHTNEIAQSEAATSKIFSRYWLHNNHIKSNGTKISKSLGNGYTLQDLEDKNFSAMEYRLFVLQSHYESEGNFSFDNLTSAKNRLLNWRNVSALRHQTHSTIDHHDYDIDSTSEPVYAVNGALIEALNNNIDTPSALRIIDEAFSEIQSVQLDKINRNALIELLETIDALLGLQLIESTPDISDEAKKILIEREHARENKDWDNSDKLRNKIESEGYVVRDTASDSIWEFQF